MKNVALITGASGGIGAELAAIHASKGNDLVIVARRMEKLTELKEELESRYSVTVLPLQADLSRPEAPQEIFNFLIDKNITVSFLINNAGFGGHGFFYEQPLEKHEGMINVNILSLVKLTYLLLPSMLKLKNGKILNISSTAAYLPGPQMAVYYASKSFVNSFTLALHVELKGTGVTVTALCPGPVDTGFAETAGTIGTRFINLSQGPAPSKVAAIGYSAMMKGKSVKIDSPILSFTLKYLLPLAPLRLIMWASGWVMVKKKK
jgi:uncharacterized protein